MHTKKDSDSVINRVPQTLEAKFANLQPGAARLTKEESAEGPLLAKTDKNLFPPLTLTHNTCVSLHSERLLTGTEVMTSKLHCVR